MSEGELNDLKHYLLSSNTYRDIGILLCLNTGMRIGEICALKWKNVDLIKREIYVRNTLLRIYNVKEKKSDIVMHSPKTKCSIRNIPISDKLFEWIIKMDYEYNGEAYFLTGEENRFVEPRNYERYFKKVLKEVGINNNYNFHVTRHTFATKCIEIGMDIKTLSEILGHSNVEITLNRYVHSSFNLKKKYLDKL